MPNRFTILNQALENCLTANMARGLFYQAYFELVERVGEEVMGKTEISINDLSGKFGPGLTASETHYIADRVEVYLKKKVFKTG